jgi:hypothetical protein
MFASIIPPVEGLAFGVMVALIFVMIGADLLLFRMAKPKKHRDS